MAEVVASEWLANDGSSDESSGDSSDVPSGSVSIQVSSAGTFGFDGLHADIANLLSA